MVRVVRNRLEEELPRGVVVVVLPAEPHWVGDERRAGRSVFLWLICSNLAFKLIFVILIFILLFCSPAPMARPPFAVSTGPTVRGARQEGGEEGSRRSRSPRRGQSQPPLEDELVRWCSESSLRVAGMELVLVVDN